MNFCSECIINVQVEKAFATPFNGSAKMQTYKLNTQLIKAANNNIQKDFKTFVISKPPNHATPFNGLAKIQIYKLNNKIIKTANNNIQKDFKTFKKTPNFEILHHMIRYQAHFHNQ